MNWVLPVTIVLSGLALWMSTGVALIHITQRSYEHDTHPDAWARRLSIAIFSIGMAFTAVWLLAIGRVIWTLVHH